MPGEAPSGENMIEIQGVSVVYGDVTALRDVSLKIDSGEFVFLVGSTGAGKSTLLKLIYAAQRATCGRVFVLGQEITKIPERKIPNLRRMMGIVPQDYGLLPKKKVWENIAYGLRAIGHTEREAQKRIAYVMELVGMSHRGQAMPKQLSGGEAQRAAIARALANNPKLLIADEPTGNLDPDTSKDIADLLLRINHKGATVVVSTHDPNIVDSLKKRVVAMERGRIVSDTEESLYPSDLDRTRAVVRSL